MNRLKFGIRSKITVGYIVIILCLLISVIFLNAQITSLQNSRNQIIQYDSQVQTLTNNIEKTLRIWNRTSADMLLLGRQAI